MDINGYPSFTAIHIQGGPMKTFISQNGVRPKKK